MCLALEKKKERKKRKEKCSRRQYRSNSFRVELTYGHINDLINPSLSLDSLRMRRSMRPTSILRLPCRTIPRRISFLDRRIRSNDVFRVPMEVEKTFYVCLSVYHEHFLLQYLWPYDRFLLLFLCLFFYFVFFFRILFFLSSFFHRVTFIWIHPIEIEID